MTTQKDDYIKQLTKIAGYTSVTLDVTLFITQIEAMLNAAYEAGQRDKNSVNESYELQVRPVVFSPEVSSALVQET